MSGLGDLKDYAIGQGFTEDEIAQHKNDPRMHALVMKAMRHDGRSGGPSQLAQSVANNTPMAPGYKSGGLVKGAGTGTSDSIPANLSSGEFVIPADVVKQFGTNALNSLISGMHTPTT